MSFTESNTVEQMILEALAPERSAEAFALGDDPPGWSNSLRGNMVTLRRKASQFEV